MKTTRIFAALMPLLMFSCAKENIVPEDNNTKPSEEIKTDGGEKYQFAVTLSPETGSKAAFDDSKGIIWLAGGKASIAKEGDESVIASAELTDEKISEDKFSATFNFEAAEGTYRLFFPHNEASKYNFFVVDVPAKQTQPANGVSSDIFAVISDDIELSAGNQEVSGIKYHAVGSYLQLAVYSENAADNEVIKSVKISVPGSSLAGKYRAHNDYTTTVDEHYSEDLTVNIDGGLKLPKSKAEAKGIYVSVLNGDYSGISYTVTTNLATYRFTSGNSRTFNNREIKPVSLNLAKATKLLYLCGENVGWDVKKAIEMTITGDDIYECTTYLKKDQQFKFLCSDDYSPKYMNAGDNKTLVYEGHYENDKNFTAPHDGLYTVKANLKEMTMSLELHPLYLVSNCTGYHFEEGQEPRLMEATGNSGEFKTERVRLYGNDTKFKFAFSDLEKTKIDYDSYDIEPDNDKDYEIAFGTEYYKNSGNSKVDAISKWSWAKSEWTTTDRKWLVKGSWDENANPKHGWTYNDKYYDITLNLETMKMTIKLSQGNTFYLVGINKHWDKTYPAEADENGIVTWTIDVTDVSDGTFKIAGTNTFEDLYKDGFWYGEWYYSQLDSQGEWHWTNDLLGSTQTALFENAGDRKWKMTSTGNYTFTFDSRDLKLTVVKNN